MIGSANKVEQASAGGRGGEEEGEVIGERVDAHKYSSTGAAVNQAVNSVKVASKGNMASD